MRFCVCGHACFVCGCCYLYVLCECVCYLLDPVLTVLCASWARSLFCLDVDWRSGVAVCGGRGRAVAVVDVVARVPLRDIAVHTSDVKAVAVRGSMCARCLRMRRRRWRSGGCTKTRACTPRGRRVVTTGYDGFVYTHSSSGAAADVGGRGAEGCVVQ